MSESDNNSICLCVTDETDEDDNIMNYSFDTEDDDSDSDYFSIRDIQHLRPQSFITQISLFSLE